METKERAKLHRVLKIAAITSLLLVCGTGYMAFSTARYMKQVVRDRFNDQQLVLARATAVLVQERIQNAMEDLVVLNSLPSVQYAHPEAQERLLLFASSILRHDSIIEIRRVDAAGRQTFLATHRGLDLNPSGPPHPKMQSYLSWASDARNRGKTMGTEVRVYQKTEGRKTIVVDFIVPTYEDSTNHVHKEATHRFAGYLCATVNVTRLIAGIILPVRPGKDGYAWVLDSSGRFIYHPERSFVGENAFAIGDDAAPTKVLEEANLIQRNEMLKGKEGTGTYVSGWHRKAAEPSERYIGFTPVRIQGPNLNYTWSVAVLLPVEEMEGIINSVHQRQFQLQGITILIILLASTVVVIYEKRWSAVLEEEVALKTAHILRYARELGQSEAKYRTLVESAEDFIFTLTTEGVIETANRHMAEALRFDSQDPAGKALQQFLPEKPAAEQLRIVDEAVRSGKSRRTEVTTTIGGTDICLDCLYIPMINEENGRSRVLGIARDITERKKLESRLINSERLASLGTLAAGVAHEMNNPLGVILGFCDLLLEKTEPGTPEYNDLKTIERHGLRCKSIVERLLSFTLRGERSEELCDLNACLQNTLSMIEETLKDANIELVCSLAQDLPPLQGESAALQQAFLNLFNNAVLAMDDKGGALTVETGLDDSRARVLARVTDTGPGMKKEWIQRIFDPFFTKRSAGDGAGLGLSEVFGIISRWGGTVECVSKTEEEYPDHPGTTFILTLPIHTRAPESFSRA
jgi:two-component system, NtrC family, sensor kinase